MARGAPMAQRANSAQETAPALVARPLAPLGDRAQVRVAAVGQFDGQAPLLAFATGDAGTQIAVARLPLYVAQMLAVSSPAGDLTRAESGEFDDASAVQAALSQNASSPETPCVLFAAQTRVLRLAAVPRAAGPAADGLLVVTQTSVCVYALTSLGSLLRVRFDEKDETVVDAAPFPRSPEAPWQLAVATMRAIHVVDASGALVSSTTIVGSPPARLVSQSLENVWIIGRDGSLGTVGVSGAVSAVRLAPEAPDSPVAAVVSLGLVSPSGPETVLLHDSGDLACYEPTKKPRETLRVRWRVRIAAPGAPLVISPCVSAEPALAILDGVLVRILALSSGTLLHQMPHGESARPARAFPVFPSDSGGGGPTLLVLYENGATARLSIERQRLGPVAAARARRDNAAQKLRFWREQMQSATAEASHLEPGVTRDAESDQLERDTRALVKHVRIACQLVASGSQGLALRVSIAQAQALPLDTAAGAEEAHKRLRRALDDLGKNLRVSHATVASPRLWGGRAQTLWMRASGVNELRLPTPDASGAHELWVTVYVRRHGSRVLRRVSLKLQMPQLSGYKCLWAPTADAFTGNAPVRVLVTAAPAVAATAVARWVTASFLASDGPLASADPAGAAQWELRSVHESESVLRVAWNVRENALCIDASSLAQAAELCASAASSWRLVEPSEPVVAVRIAAPEALERLLGRIIVAWERTSQRTLLKGQLAALTNQAVGLTADLYDAYSLGITQLPVLDRILGDLRDTNAELELANTQATANETALVEVLRAVNADFRSISRLFASGSGDQSNEQRLVERLQALNRAQDRSVLERELGELLVSL